MSEGGVLNTDAEGIRTSAEYEDRGDGNTGWVTFVKVADGGIVALGDRSDASAPSGDGTVIALLKAIRDLGVSSLMIPTTSGAASSTAPTNAVSTAYETNRVIKASQGVLFGVTGHNARTSGQFIQLHNAISLPADTAVPVVTLWVPASSSFSLDWGVFGRVFTTGIVICNSSTGPTKTIGSADCWFDCQYK